MPSRYIEILLKRNHTTSSPTLWQTYSTQIWYEDMVHAEYYCPLGKQVVDFCYEPEFRDTSMHLLGREWLDEKDKSSVIVFSMPVKHSNKSEGKIIHNMVFAVIVLVM